MKKKLLNWSGVVSMLFLLMSAIPAQAATQCCNCADAGGGSLKYPVPYDETENKDKTPDQICADANVGAGILCSTKAPDADCEEKIPAGEAGTAKSQGLTSGCVTSNKGDTICPLQNPLAGDVKSIPKIIGNVIKYALGFMGALALFMFVWGASNWLMSAGNPEKVKAGTQTMLFAAIGVAVVLASYFLVDTTITFFTKGTFPGEGSDTPITGSRQNPTGGTSGTCDCKFTVAGTACNVSKNFSFPFGQTVSITNFLDQVSAAECQAKLAVSQTVDTSKSIQVDAGTCSSLSNLGSSQGGYSVTANCVAQQ